MKNKAPSHQWVYTVTPPDSSIFLPCIHPSTRIHYPHTIVTPIYPVSKHPCHHFPSFRTFCFAANKIYLSPFIPISDPKRHSIDVPLHPKPSHNLLPRPRRHHTRSPIIHPNRIPISRDLHRPLHLNAQPQRPFARIKSLLTTPRRTTSSLHIRLRPIVFPFQASSSDRYTRVMRVVPQF